MPTATAPVGRPSGFTKPAGFTKPNGFAKPVKEEKEPTKPGPVTLVCCILGLLAMLLVCWKQYEVDQIATRTAKADDFFFGLPEGSAKGDDDAASSAENFDEESSSDDEEESSESEEEETPAEEPAESEEAPAEESDEAAEEVSEEEEA